MNPSRPLDVMITVDVECWPRLATWRDDELEGDLKRDIYGATPEGDFGIQYQIDLLKKHGLKGVFFVEALFACEVGIEPLARIVDIVQSGGSEVQLHIHTEWFEKMTQPILGKNGAPEAYNISELTREQQVVVISRAIDNLRNAGAENVIAYRAGNFGADFETIQALEECGVLYDSSYNYCYLDKDCGLSLPEMLVQPTPLGGVIEYPVSCFRDYPGHYRPAQLCAVTAAEMRSAMAAAYRAHWRNFVIVSHSFELLRDRKRALPYGQPDWSVIRRFEKLCEHLDNNRTRYRTIGFTDLDDSYSEGGRDPLHLPLLATAIRTGGRYLSQAMRRLPFAHEQRVRNFLDRVGVHGL